MEKIKNKRFNKEELHHSYICLGETASVRNSLMDFIENDFSIPVEGNPNVLELVYENMGIDDARYLRERQLHKAVNSEKKFFIISFKRITIEAQNSLLKIFEEPTEGTHFFVVTETLTTLIPTLLSRMQVEHFGHTELGDDVIKAFLESSPKERMDFLKDIIEEKDKSGLMRLLEGMARVLRGESGKKGATEALHNISLMLNYLYDRGSSVKMIAEYVALTTTRFVL